MSRYEVVGPRAVYETPPGGQFERELTPEQEQHLIDAGHLVKVNWPIEGAPTRPRSRTKAKRSARSTR
jgi:hypothetical protein